MSIILEHFQRRLPIRSPLLETPFPYYFAGKETRLVAVDRSEVKNRSRLKRGFFGA